MVRKGTLSVLRQFVATDSPLKIMKKRFLFHCESSFRSQILVLTFSSCVKTALLERYC